MADEHPCDLSGEETVAAPPVASEEPSDGAPPKSVMQVQPGTLVDRYHLISKLGEGGFGVVYLASHKSFPKRRYALKLVRPDRIASEQFSARFAKEIQAMGDLDHPNVVYATDAGEWNGLQYLAMDYVDGIALNHLQDDSSPLPIADACELVRQAAIGMQHVHEKERTHRDLKPSNLMLDRSGVVRILDLGLAKLRGDTESEGEPLTAMGQMMGTPDYMAPEQWEDSSTADIRADIYSLGCTLFCLLAGRPPFGDGEHRSTVAKMKAHTTKEPPDVCSLREDVSPEISAVVKKCLQRSPDERYQTPQELAEALESMAKPASLASLVAASPSVPVLDQSQVSTGIKAHLASTVINNKEVKEDSAGGPGRRVSKLQLGFQAPGCMISLQIGMAVMLVAGLSFWFSGAGSGTDETIALTDTGNEVDGERDGISSRQRGNPPELSLVESRAAPSAIAMGKNSLNETTLAIEHFRADSDGVPERIGEIGRHEQKILLNDVVRLAIDLKSRRHVMIVAFNPDGSVQLCVPADESAPATAIRQLEFPAEPDLYFGLTDGKGQQAFLVLTSEEPLPVFSELRPKLEALGWTTVTTGGLWQFDGSQVSQVFPGRQERGSIERLTAKGFRKLCLSVKEKFPQLSVTGFAFPVE